MELPDDFAELNVDSDVEDGIRQAYSAVQDDPEKKPIVVDSTVLLSKYNQNVVPHGYVTPGSPPVGLTPYLERRIDEITEDSGSIITSNIRVDDHDQESQNNAGSSLRPVAFQPEDDRYIEALDSELMYFAVQM